MFYKAPDITGDHKVIQIEAELLCPHSGIYRASNLTKEEAEKHGLVPINVNIVDVIDINIDKTRQDLMDAWDPLREYFYAGRWCTVCYFKKPSLWKRFIDFWWMK